MPLPIGRASGQAGFALAAATALLGACASVPPEPAGAPLHIFAINDLHGNLLPSESEVSFREDGQERNAVLGGAERMAGLLAQLRESAGTSITVAAGDLVGASPLYSAYFLDEPTIAALNLLGLDIAAVGNHEFDRGTRELRRLQQGGCEQHTRRVPCAVENFEGADFAYLAGNVVDGEGHSLFPGTAIRDLAGLRIGFIGLTLKETAKLVSPEGTRGYSFLDEARTANALASDLRARGADEVVLLIHEGGATDPAFSSASCPGLSGAIMPILDALDPAIRLIVSGHTHRAYVCDVPAPGGGTRLLTSAGRYGYFVTDVAIRVDRRARRFATLAARNMPVVARDVANAEIARLVSRYLEASREMTGRVAGTLTGSPVDDADCVDTWTQDLVADAQLAAASSAGAGNAGLAFINSGGVRTEPELAADGSVTFGQLFAMQPFGNRIVVLEMTGAQIRSLLEDQFCEEEDGAGFCYSSLTPSANLAYEFDASLAAGSRIIRLSLDGAPVDPAATYRVAVNDFLASGGDGFDAFAQAAWIGEAGTDIEAMEAYLAQGPVPVPHCGRVRRQ